MRVKILRYGILLALATLGTSAATAQTELFFATGVDSTGWAQAQSNADGHVLIESPQYPRGLWLHLVDEAGNALAGIRVEYQSRPDNLVAIRCVDPAGEVRETLVWTRSEGAPLSLILNPSESTDLPAGLASIDWQIDPGVTSLLEPAGEIRLIGWEEVSAFLRERWQGQSGRVAAQIDTHTALAIDLGRPESIEMLVNYLQDQAKISLREINTSTLQVLLDAQVFKSDLSLLEDVIILSTSFVVVFEDPKLEKWVLKALGQPEGPIPLREAASLTHLLVFNKNIHSLAGIEHLTALQWLDLFDNQIDDLTPLAALRNLELLALGGNQITDVTPLANLKNLEHLGLSNNQITDVNPLAAMTNLKGLGLGSNQLTDVTPLANLKNLVSLTLDDIQLTDVTPLAGLKNLAYLRLSDNLIDDVTPLANLKNLVSLLLSRNQLTDITPLANLTDLTRLELSSNQLTDVTPLANLKNLVSLQLWRNQITAVTPLANLTNLPELELGFNLIDDVTPLANLKNLVYLGLSSNQLTDVTPLANLTNLTRLYLNSNQLTDVTPLANLTNLTELGLGSNLIDDVTPLANLKNLVYLGLWDNRIEDLAPLVANVGLGEGNWVDLANNPLSAQARTEHIPALQARGVYVRVSD